jgi:hypothetical protein
MGEAGLVVEPALAEHTVNAVAKQLCEDALAALGDAADEAPLAPLRARLLAQRSHLAFYDGDLDRVGQLSSAALDLARRSRDDRALVDALRARQEACPRPTGRPERLLLATEMLALAQRTNNARTAMWGTLWRIDALAEGGQLGAAAEELAALEVHVRRVGGPVSAWYLDRATAFLAQAQGQFAHAAAAAGRGFDRMRAVEYAAARGTHFALHCALAHHVGVTEVGAVFVQHPFDPPLHYATMVRLHRAFLLLRAGQPDEAAASYQQAGRPTSWSLPGFLVLVGHVLDALIAAELGRFDDLTDGCSTGWNPSVASTPPATVSSTWVRSTSASAVAPPPSAASTARSRTWPPPSSRPTEPARRGSPPKRATTSRRRCSPAPAPAIVVAPSRPPATPTASPRRWAWRRTPTGPQRSSRISTASAGRPR